MKKNNFLISIIVFSMLISSCSSIPKKERVGAVNQKKEQSALFLSRGHKEYGWNQYESSMKLYQSSFSLAASVDWEEGMIRSLVHLSRSADRIADKDKSLEYLLAAGLLLGNRENSVLNILVGNRKTEWLLFNKSPEEAVKQSQMVLPLLGSHNSEEAGETWRIQAAAYKKMKNYDQALESIEKAISLDKKQNYIAELASDYYIKASILSLQGLKDKAIESMRLALKEDKFIENTPAIAQDLYALALIYEKTGQTKEADYYFQRAYLVYKGDNRDNIPDYLIEKLNNIPESSLLFHETDLF